MFGFFGAIYAVAAVVARRRVPRRWRCACSARADRRSALRTYLFSLAYLALLFGAMVVDARVLG